MSDPVIKHDLQIKFGSLYGSEEEAAMLKVLREGAATSGNVCRQFELDFARYHGRRYAKAVTNGTAALTLAMKAIDLKPGDQVLTTPLTWIATASAAVVLGAEIDFVDVDPITLNMSPEALEKKISAKTRAVVPVHLYGLACDMDPILALAHRHNAYVIEDACHAIGGSYHGHKAGSMGDLACFSFHEQKNISTLGEGGMVVTDDADLFERVSLYRSHCTRVYGPSTKYCLIDEVEHPRGKQFWRQEFDDCGFNFRLTDIQAAVGIEQLKKLDDFNRRRNENARFLSELLKEVPGLLLPQTPAGYYHTYHLYRVQIDEKKFGSCRDDVIYDLLYRHGIKAGVHYPALHLTKAFQRLGHRPGDYPIAESAAQKLMTLPIGPRQQPQHLEYLAHCIRALAVAAAD